MLKFLSCAFPLLLTSALVSSQNADTLGLHDFNTGTRSLYESPNGGFSFGNNGYSDRSKVQIFLPEHPVELQNVLLQFGSVSFTSNDPTSVVRVNVYLLNGQGITTVGNVASGAPDSILAFVDIPMSDIVMGGAFTIADFSFAELEISSWFGVGIDLSRLAAGDTIGLYSTTDGDGMQRQRCWEQEADGTWITVLSQFSWALDVDLAIFPVVESNTTSAQVFDSVKLMVYPNPSDGRFVVVAGTNSPHEITVFSPDGKTLLHITGQNIQEYIDISSYLSGVYLLRVTDALSSLTSRVIVR